MIHAETTNEDMTSVEIKGSIKKLISEFTGVAHTLRENLEEEYGKGVARAMLKTALKLAFDDDKINEAIVPDEGFDGGVQ